MRKKYLSALLFGALLVTSAGTFTSCKDYDDEINNLQEQIDKVVADLESLKSEVDKLGGYVTDVKIEDGKLVVTVDGKEPVSYELPAGAEMAEIKIENGHLYVGNEDKGEVGGSKVEVNEDGVLVIDNEATEIKVGTDVVIKDASNGIYTIQIGDETIQLPMASANVQVDFISGEFKNFVWGVVPENAAKWRGANQTAGTVLVSEDAELTVSVTPYSYELDKQTLKLVDTTGKYADVEITPEPVGKAEEGKPATGGDSRSISYNGKWNLSIEMKDTKVDGDYITNFETEEHKLKLYALEIAGKVVTPYSFTIKPNKKNNTTIDASNVKLYLNGSTTAFNDVSDVLSITKDNVFTASTETTNIVADSYLVFEGKYADMAKSYGVEIVDDMTIRASEKAAAKENLKVKLYTLGVNGSVTSQEIDLDFATSEVEAGEVSVEDHKVTFAADNTKSFWVNVANVFTYDELQQFGNLSGVDGDDADTRGLFATIKDAEGNSLFNDNTLSLVLYKDKETKFNTTTDVVSDLKYINVLRTSAYRTGAKPGVYTLTLTLKDDKGNEIKKVAADFNVTLPAFSDIFLKRTSWDNEVKRTTNESRQITVTQGDLYYTTTDKNYSSLQVEKLKLVMTNVDETKTTVDGANTTITLGEDIISEEGKVLKSIKAKYEYEIMGEKLSSPEFTITPYSKADGVSFVWYGNDFSATPKDVIEWTYNTNIGSSAQEIAGTTYVAGTSGDDKGKFKGLAAVIGSNKYDLNDDLSGVTYTAEITNPGYKNVEVKITNGKLTFQNESGQEIIKSPEGTYYDLQVKIIAKEGVIKNDGIVTVRVKK